MLFFAVLYEEELGAEGLEMRDLSDQPLERANTVLKGLNTSGRKETEKHWL